MQSNRRVLDQGSKGQEEADRQARVLDDFFLLESLHAAIRRQLRAAGIQTHRIDFIDLCAKWVADRARSRNKDSFLRAHQALSGEPVEESSSDDDEDSDGDNAGGGGGLWRLFVWHNSLGKHGLPNMTELAARYHALTPADLREMIPIAQAATTAHRQGGAGGASSFGPTTREVQAAARRDTQQALQASIADELAGTTLAVRDLTQNTTPTQAVACARAEAATRTSSFGDALAVGRQAQLAMQALAKKTRQEEDAKMKEWIARFVAGRSQAVMSALPLAAEELARFEPQPSRVMSILNYNPDFRPLVET